MVRLLYLAVLLSVLAAGVRVQADEIERRQAFRKEVESHPDKVVNYVGDADAEIRRYALYLIAKREEAAAKPYLMKAMKDENELVRLTALGALIKFCKADDDVQKLLTDVAATDSSRQVAVLAGNATWPFHREVLLLRNDPNWDHEVEVIHKFQIPDDKWLFHLDRKENGHTKRFKWYEERIDEKDWVPIKQGEWEDQGFEYDGVAWYRIRFMMPEKMDCNAVELAFGAVDESAWVWLNGEYLGCHDLGPSGWNVPFALDCRKEIRWGAENVLVVRVLDTLAAGGIAKPICVDVLR